MSAKESLINIFGSDLRLKQKEIKSIPIDELCEKLGGYSEEYVQKILRFEGVKVSVENRRNKRKKIGQKKIYEQTVLEKKQSMFISRSLIRA